MDEEDLFRAFSALAEAIAALEAQLDELRERVAELEAADFDRSREERRKPK